MSALDKAARDVSRLQREVASKENAVHEAEAAAKLADEQCAVSGAANEDVDKSSRAHAKVRLARTELSTASEALDRAREEHRRLHHAEVERQFVAAAPALESWANALPLGTIEKAEKALDDAVLCVVRQVAAAQSEYDRLTKMAEELGGGAQLAIEYPSIAQARLLSQRHLVSVREREGRESLATWIAPPPGEDNWALRGVESARELEQAAAFTAMNGGNNGR